MRLSHSKGAGVAGGERARWAERGGEATRGQMRKGIPEVVLASSVLLMKQKPLEGSVQRSDMIGLYVNRLFLTDMQRMFPKRQAGSRKLLSREERKKQRK